MCRSPSNDPSVLEVAGCEAEGEAAAARALRRDDDDDDEEDSAAERTGDRVTNTQCHQGALVSCCIREGMLVIVIESLTSALG